MLKVNAYECEVCHRLYKSRKKCSLCEAECNNLKLMKEIELRKSQEREAVINFPRLNSRTIQELEENIVEAYYRLFKFEITNLKLHIKRKELCSNSHIKPIGGVTNWCNLDKTLPRGYLGYSGSISFDCVWDSINKCYPQINKICGICTGSGASGNYTLTLFESDFPLLKIDL